MATSINNQLLAMDDVRYAAYAYYKELGKYKIDAAVTEFFHEIEPEKELIPFKSFKAHMIKLGMSGYASENFFNKLATGGANRDSLQYMDIVTLLFIINTGRPFCQKCKRFVEGLFFTCVQCFHEEKDYHFNFCTSCYNDFLKNPKIHKELGDHKELPGHAHFLDPVTLLLLKVNKDSGQTSQQRKVTSRSAQPRIKNVLKIVKFVVDSISVGTTVAQLCTIM